MTRVCRDLQTSYIIIFTHYLPLCLRRIRDVNHLFIQRAYDAHITHSCTSIIACRKQFFCVCVCFVFDQRLSYWLNKRNTGVSFKIMCSFLDSETYYGVMPFLILWHSVLGMSGSWCPTHDSCRRMRRTVYVTRIWNVQLKSFLRRRPLALRGAHEGVQALIVFNCLSF